MMTVLIISNQAYHLHRYHHFFCPANPSLRPLAVFTLIPTFELLSHQYIPTNESLFCVNISLFLIELNFPFAVQQILARPACSRLPISLYSPAFNGERLQPLGQDYRRIKGPSLLRDYRRGQGRFIGSIVKLFRCWWDLEKTVREIQNPAVNLTTYIKKS